MPLLNIINPAERTALQAVEVKGVTFSGRWSAVDWAFSTEPQKHLYGRSIFLPRRKVLGGCSSTNAMAYLRGNHADYDEWATLGNSGWAYLDVLPYFKKSEFNEDLQKKNTMVSKVGIPNQVRPFV